MAQKASFRGARTSYTPRKPKKSAEERGVALAVRGPTQIVDARAQVAAAKRELAAKKKQATKAKAKAKKAAKKVATAKKKVTKAKRKVARAVGSVGAPPAKPKKKGKRKSKAKGATKSGMYGTKVQLGRKVVVAECPTGSTLLIAGMAKKSPRTGKKKTLVLGRCVEG